MKISISAASRLTGKHRSTVGSVASELQSFPGPKGALLYDSRELLQRLHIGRRRANGIRSTPAIKHSAHRASATSKRNYSQGTHAAGWRAQSGQRSLPSYCRHHQGQRSAIVPVNDIFAQLRDIPNRLGWDMPPRRHAADCITATQSIPEFLPIARFAPFARTNRTTLSQAVRSGFVQPSAWVAEKPVFALSDLCWVKLPRSFGDRSDTRGR